MMKPVVQPPESRKIPKVDQLIIDVTSQQLLVLQNGKLLHTYAVSTALNGLGEKKDSGQTPRGWHIIRAKIGQGKPENTIFVGRRAQAQMYTSELAEKYPDRDWILSRIMWLSGLEVGKNRLGDCDTMQRFIYIHGCPETKPLGIPLSKGCIRMHNKDIIELFDMIPIGTKVFIKG